MFEDLEMANSEYEKLKTKYGLNVSAQFRGIPEIFRNPIARIPER